MLRGQLVDRRRVGSLRARRFVPDGALRAERRRDILSPNPALLLPSLGAVASRVAAGVADLVAGQQPESLFKSIVWRRCASAGRGRRGIEGLRAPGERATEGRHVASEDTFLTLGMQRWRIGMRLRNVRTPGEGGAGGRQNSVGESLLRGQSAVGPNARGACCPSAADQSSVFNRHNALFDWAVGRNLRRSYCSAAIA
jgi:hypothetical protein